MPPFQLRLTLFDVMQKDIIIHSLEEARKELDRFLSDDRTVDTMSEMVDVLRESLENGGKVICCGNGGSLCDATHFAEELTGRFRSDRRPLPAISINDPAYLTCTSNDFEYDAVFSRFVEAFGKSGDVLLAISTSGESRNVVRAAELARKLGMKVIALAADRDSTLSGLADVCLRAPVAPHSDRIQEIHIKVIHIVIEALEYSMGL